MFVQLNKCVVVCGSVLQRGHSGDGCLTCDPAVLSSVEACADHGGVNVFHVCLDSGVVYDVRFVSTLTV